MCFIQGTSWLDQVPPNNQRINQLLAISESCTTGDSPDDLEAEFLPDFDGGCVVFKDEVKDGVFVALYWLIPVNLEDIIWGEWTYQLRRILQIRLTHDNPNTLIPSRIGRQKPRVAHMRTASCHHH